MVSGVVSHVVVMAEMMLSSPASPSRYDIAPAPSPASSLRTGQFDEMISSSLIIEMRSRAKMSLPPPGPVCTRNSTSSGSEASPPPPSDSPSESLSKPQPAANASNNPHSNTASARR
jgi:hypothetical protein